MKNKDIEVLIGQLRSIILNRPLKEPTDRVKDEELRDLQEGIEYLSKCINETNVFLKDLSRGNLEASVPNRHNLLAGNVKELHSGLRHLTWQAEQVAKGDYNQRVNFFGDFSKSFNTMVEQLAEREDELKRKNEAISRSMEFMVNLMNNFTSMIIVVSQKTGSILYINDSAKEWISQYSDEGVSKKELLKNLFGCSKDESDSNKEIVEHKILCGNNYFVYDVKTYAVQWDSKTAYAYVINDITDENREKANLEKFAFKDELTGAFNRRYCMTSLEELLAQKIDFTLCMVDLDGLKIVNDKFGHGSGDDYIQTVSHTIHSMIREHDKLCRIGGDEFVIVFEHCSLGDAKNKMKKIYKRFSSIKRDYPMSFSYGLVFVDEDNELSIMEIIDTADEYMYKNKRLRKKMRK